MERIKTSSAWGMRLSEHLYAFQDSCNVYVLACGQQIVLIDFGSGDVLDWIELAGLGQVTDVLVTHHHRDQVQGLDRAIQAGARIWVPEAEQEFFTQAEAFWQAREIYNNYNPRQDRFSILQSIPISGTLRDYECMQFGNWSVSVIPTPGHTPGSVTLLTQVDDQRVAFSGDLIAGPGKLWSMAATQWTYNGCEGVAATLASLVGLQNRNPEVLYPAHGQVMQQPAQAIQLLINRIEQFLNSKGQYTWVRSSIANPYEQVSSHVLHNKHSDSDSYVLLSDSGDALVIDFGYDFNVGIPAGYDRGARRPWLYSLEALKTNYEIRKIEVVIPTHYHDDHVAGMNLLRRAEGTQVWSTQAIADIIQDPGRWDLPCLWYDSIPVDKVLPLVEPIRWQEYELTFYPLAGHTHYAVAISFEADGKRYLATGDQYQYEEPPLLNYVYQNRFQIGDYRDSAALLRRLNPDILLSGHWGPRSLTMADLDDLECRAFDLDLLHHALLADEIHGLGAAGAVARLEPYQAIFQAGQTSELDVEIQNPFAHPESASIQLVLPPGWSAEPDNLDTWLGVGSPCRVSFRVTPPKGLVCRRARLSVDLRVGEQFYGQAAEALIDVR